MTLSKSLVSDNVCCLIGAGRPPDTYAGPSTLTPRLNRMVAHTLRGGQNWTLKTPKIKSLLRADQHN